jgi:4-amino-4-deoxy-L-arabinose transferase-like glycosyltransferase
MDAATPEAVAFQGPFATGHQFLYKDHDADRLLYRARFMNVLFGVLLGVMVFAWAGELWGFRAGAVALGLFTVEPTLAAHAGLATTDLGVTCFIFGAVYFLWRMTRRVSVANLVGLTICFALAILSKFSAALLVPIVILLAWLSARQRGTLSSRAIVALVAWLGVSTWLAIWSIYGFRFAPSHTPGWLFALHQHPAVQHAVPTLSAVVAWIDSYHLFPNAFSQGFLHGQGLVQGRPSFLAGNYSNFGWWYYFPVAFLVKTPLALIAALLFGLVKSVRRRTLLSSDGEAFLVIPAVVFLAAAMSSALNIGVRHILPIYPFVILIAAKAFDQWLSSRSPWPSRAAVALLAVAFLEFASVYPNNLAFFNRAVGGPSQGFRWLADSNLDWGQALKPLKRWMDANRVTHINLAYFGVADPAYYGIDCTYMGGTTIPGMTPAMLRPPRLPGYVAVSTTLLDGVPFDERSRDFYKPLRDREPSADIGGSIKVYWVERQWW